MLHHRLFESLKLLYGGKIPRRSSSAQLLEATGLVPEANPQNRIRNNNPLAC